MPILNSPQKSSENFNREERPLHFFDRACHIAYIGVIHPHIGTRPIFDNNRNIISAQALDINFQRVDLDLAPILIEQDKLWATYLINTHFRNQRDEFEHHQSLFHQEVYEAVKRLEIEANLAPSKLTLEGNDIIARNPEEQYTVGVSTPHVGGFVIRDSSSAAQTPLNTTEQPYVINDPLFVHLGPEFIMPVNMPPVVGTLNNSTPFTICIDVDGVAPADANPAEVLPWESYDIPYVESAGNPYQTLKIERKITV